MNLDILRQEILPNVEKLYQYDIHGLSSGSLHQYRYSYTINPRIAIGIEHTISICLGTEEIDVRFYSPSDDRWRLFYKNRKVRDFKRLAQKAVDDICDMVTETCEFLSEEENALSESGFEILRPYSRYSIDIDELTIEIERFVMAQNCFINLAIENHRHATTSLNSEKSTVFDALYDFLLLEKFDSRNLRIDMSHVMMSLPAKLRDELIKRGRAE